MWDAIVKCLVRVEAEVPACWMERLLISLHFFSRTHGEPDETTRQLLAQKQMVRRLLHILMEGENRLGVTDPCVAALAMSFFHLCLSDGKGKDCLYNSIDFKVLLRFTVNSMEAFPGSNIIQGYGCMILNEVPQVYRLLACNGTTVIAPGTNCYVENQDDDPTVLSTMVSQIVGPCWNSNHIPSRTLS